MIGRTSGVAVERGATSPSEQPGCRTLLVDDVADLRQLYRCVLEESGRFEVVGEAGDGDEAVELASELQPDLVVLDVSMPERDGMEIMPDIIAQAPGATVVMVSGFEARRLEPLALERGAVAFLEKGITPDRLVSELLRAIGADQDAPGPHADVRSSGRHVEDPEITPEDLLSLVAHEIRSPLSVVQGFAETLALEVNGLGPGGTRHISNRIAANARYLDGIVSSVLQLRAISQGDLLLGCEAVDPRSLLPGLVEHLQTEVPDVRLDLDLGPSLSPMVADPARFRQVLTNLVGNAAKHSPPGGVVRIEVAADGPHVVVAVQDEGPGIPEEDRERVFERFVRLDGGTTGIGLGLYISRALVEAMGGTIAVEDGPVGARLVVRLPVEDDHPRAR